MNRRKAPAGAGLLPRMRKLREVYAQVPDVGCKGLCQRACGPVPALPVEKRILQSRVPPEQLKLVVLPVGNGQGVQAYYNTETGSCPMLDRAGRCSIYADRPLVCRLWGATEDLPCQWGCAPDGGRMSKEQGAALFEQVKSLSQGLE